MVNLSKIYEEATKAMAKLSENGCGDEAFLLQRVLRALDKETQKRKRLEEVVKEQNKYTDEQDQRIKELEQAVKTFTGSF